MEVRHSQETTKIMARLRREEFVNLPSGRSGAAVAYGTLAERLSGFSKKMSVEADRLTDIEASRAGAERSAGKLTSDLPDGMTIADVAYRETAIRGHTAAIKNHISEANTRFQQENPLDLEQYDNQFREFSSGLLNGIDPALKPGAQVVLDDEYTRGSTNISGNQKKQTILEATAATTQAYEDLLMWAEKDARNGDIETATARQMAAIGLLDDPLQFSPEAARKMTDAFSDSIDIMSIMGEFDRTGNKSGFIADFRKFGKGTEDLTVAQVSKLESWMQAEINSLDAQRNSALSALNRQAKDAVTMVTRGHSKSSDYAPLLGQIHSMNPEAAAAFETQMVVAERVNHFSGLPLGAIQAEIDRTDITSITESDYIVEMEKLKADAEKALTNDNIVEYAVNGAPEFYGREVVSEFTPENLAMMREHAAKVGDDYGVPDANPFMSIEIDAATRLFNASTGLEKLAFSQNIAEGLEEDAVTTFNAIAEKGGITFAWIGKKLVDGDGATANHILQGSELDKIFLPKEVAPYVTARLSAMYPFDHKKREASTQVAMSIYKSLNQSSGGSIDVMSEDMADKAVNMTLTGTENVFGNRVPLPEPGVSRGTFEDFFLANVPVIPGQTKDVTRDFIESGEYKPIENGEGQYNLQYNRIDQYRDPTIGLVLGEDNKPAVIRWADKKDSPEKRSRRPTGINR